jgi:hypothetical protein
MINVVREGDQQRIQLIKDNIKIDFKEIGWANGKWIYRRMIGISNGICVHGNETANFTEGGKVLENLRCFRTAVHKFSKDLIVTSDF